jgi:DNA-binding beta-propeller fold protein YncE
LLSSAPRRKRAAATILPLVLGLAACSSGGDPAPASQSAQIGPARILAAPKDVLSAGEPQPNGTMWVLAGDSRSRGLYKFDLGNGQTIGSKSVSGAAQAVTQSLSGVIGLALGSKASGSLELLNGSTGTVTRNVPLGAPARAVVVGSDGSTFYVLNGTTSSASVTIVDSQDGRVQGTVPVPLDTVSVAPSSQQTTLYALQPDGQVSQIAIAGGKIMARFPVGDSGHSLAISPDGTTMYVLKDLPGATNVAMLDLATETVRKALPAPSNCLEVLVSADGNQLYEVVGSADYGNIQVFPV